MTSAASEFRRGWRNLAAATIGLGFGVPSYTAVSSLFFQPLRSEFGWTSAATAGALVALPLTAAVLPFAGRLIDRVGVRLVAGVSVLCFAASLLWLSHLRGDLPEFYAAVIALNVLGCATGPVAYTRLVAAEFRGARGTALAAAQFGIALIGAILPPVLATLMVEFGWRGAYVALAVGALLGGASAQVLMKSGRAAAGGAGPAAGYDARTAIRQGAFWRLGLATMLVSAASLGLVTQFQPVLADRGVDARTGAWLLSTLAVAVMASRLIVGRLLDAPRPERWAAVVIAVAAAGAAILLAAGASLPALVAAVLLFGVSVGAELDLMAYFCSRLFGMRHYSSLYGLLSIFFYLGLAAGGVAYGLIRDRTGGYGAAIGGSGILLLGAALLFLTLRSALSRHPVPDAVDAVGE